MRPEKYEIFDPCIMILIIPTQDTFKTASKWIDGKFWPRIDQDDLDKEYKKTESEIQKTNKADEYEIETLYKTKTLVVYQSHLYTKKNELFYRRNAAFYTRGGIYYISGDCDPKDKEFLDQSIYKFAERISR